MTAEQQSLLDDTAKELFDYVDNVWIIKDLSDHIHKRFGIASPYLNFRDALFHYNKMYEAAVNGNMVTFIQQSACMEFWDNINVELERLGENWRWLGKNAAVPESTLSRWRDQNKYPSVEKAVKMAQAVGCSVEYLVTGKAPAGLSEESLKIAFAAERLDETGKADAFHLVQSLEALHPLEKADASSHL